MHRLLAIAKYGDRDVIPTAHVEGADPNALAHRLEESATECSLDYDGGPGMTGPFGESSGAQTPVSVENFHILKERQTSDDVTRSGRVNLLNWDGRGSALPPRAEEPPP